MTNINLKQTIKAMKKILCTMLCVAMIISCGNNKAKNDGCPDCNKSKTECTQKQDGCNKGKCDKNTTCNGQECKKDVCDSKCGDCNNNKDCKEQKCKKQDGCKKDGKCGSHSPESAANAGCIIADNEIFLSKIADYKNPEWKFLGDKPAIVDFYADWCGPCKMIAPKLEEIAKEYAGKLDIYKVNVDNCPEIANAFQISGIPTLLYIPVNGEPLKVVGGMDKEAILENIAKIMK